MLQSIVLQKNQNKLKSANQSERHASSARISQKTGQKQNYNLMFSSTTSVQNSSLENSLLSKSQISSRHSKGPKIASNQGRQRGTQSKQTSQNRVILLDEQVNSSKEKEGNEDISIQLIKRNYYRPTNILMHKSQSVRQMKDRSPSGSQRGTDGFQRSTSTSSRNKNQSSNCDSILNRKGLAQGYRDSSVGRHQQKKSLELNSNLRIS